MRILSLIEFFFIDSRHTRDAFPTYVGHDQKIASIVLDLLIVAVTELF